MVNPMTKTLNEGWFGAGPKSKGVGDVITGEDTLGFEGDSGLDLDGGTLIIEGDSGLGFDGGVLVKGVGEI
jgi:hypothetical protein